MYYLAAEARHLQRVGACAAVGSEPVHCTVEFGAISRHQYLVALIGIGKNGVIFTPKNYLLLLRYSLFLI